MKDSFSTARKRVILAAALASASISLPVFADELPVAKYTRGDMVVTANPLASEAGAYILRRGGTAVDAMVAVQTVLGLVEPQSSGLGGGAFVVYYDAATDTTTTIDAREKAPASATENRFEGLGFFDAWQSGLSVGVPGVPAMMEYMHQRYGKLKWRKLFKPAKRLAKRGFRLTERTSDQVTSALARNTSCDDRLFLRDPTALAYFADPTTCVAKPAGTLIRNHDYADTLKQLARNGSAAFYTGEIAEAIANAVQNDPAIAGDMTVEDLAAYNVVERTPVCIDYRGHDVCGMGPPSSGALAVGQILGILENFDLTGLSEIDVETIHLFSQAGRLAFADRGKFVADSDFVDVPVSGMLDKDYLKTRAALIGSNDMGPAEPGNPPGSGQELAADVTTKNSGTSHVSIVDRYGNALSMTTTIESSLGNGVMVKGFLLNNELTDFSFSPTDDDGVPIANRVQPNKRPRSSMSPTIVFDGDGNVKLVTGSPGGSRIIGYTAQSVMNVIDFGLDPQQAINVPHFMNRNGSTTDLEPPTDMITIDYDVDAVTAELEARLHNVRVLDQTSGLSIIQVDGRRLVGGGDQRRDGTVSGNNYRKKCRNKGGKERPGHRCRGGGRHNGGGGKGGHR